MRVEKSGFEGNRIIEPDKFINVFEGFNSTCGLLGLQTVQKSSNVSHNVFFLLDVKQFARVAEEVANVDLQILSYSEKLFLNIDAPLNPVLKEMSSVLPLW